MLLGKGCNSQVYDNGNDTVIMVGKFSRDMFKLAVHALLGKLQSIQLNGETYNAVIERMFSERFLSDDEINQIYDMQDIVDRLNLRYHDGFEFLSNLSSLGGMLQQVADFILTLNPDLNGLNFWVDNDTQNWMIDNAGNVVPFDLFDFSDRDLSEPAQSVIKSILNSYMR